MYEKMKIQQNVCDRICKDRTAQNWCTRRTIKVYLSTIILQQNWASSIRHMIYLKKKYLIKCCIRLLINTFIEPNFGQLKS